MLLETTDGGNPSRRLGTPWAQQGESPLTHAWPVMAEGSHCAVVVAVASFDNVALASGTAGADAAGAAAAAAAGGGGTDAVAGAAGVAVAAAALASAAGGAAETLG